MFHPQKIFKRIRPHVLPLFLIIAIVVGVAFRFVALDGKVYWHDEVYTTLRASGYTAEEFSQEFFQNRLVSPADLLQYQQLKPGSTPLDTLQSLTEEPQHPPLYFLLARGWMASFGHSILVSRLLPVFISLISLALMYILARELFQSSLAALLATAFLSLSPVEILFAQTNRQYSLLTLFIIASSYCLLKAIQGKNFLFWGAYSLLCTLGLYTHPLFGLTLLGHGSYLLLMSINSPQRYSPKKYQFLSSLFVQFLGAFTIILILYSPWLWILNTHWEHVYHSTQWTEQSISLVELFKLWVFNFTSVWVDTSQWDVNQIGQLLLRVPFFILLITAIYKVSENRNLSTRLLILTSIFIPFILLALPDILNGGIRSSIIRFLVPCFPGVILAITYLFFSQLKSGRTSLIDGEIIWRFVLAFVLTSSIISLSFSAFSEGSWHYYPSHKNAEIARQLNQEKSSILILDGGEDYTNLGNSISLSYRLKPNVKLLMVNSQPNLLLLPIGPKIFVLNPSQELRQTIETYNYQLEPVDQQARLWKLK